MLGHLESAMLGNSVGRSSGKPRGSFEQSMGSLEVHW